MQVNKKHFQAVLKAVAPLVGNSILPILECVYIEKGLIKAHSLEISLDLKFQYAETMSDFQPICVPFKELNSLINSCTSETIDFYTLPGNRLQVIAGRAKSTLTGESASDFPNPVEHVSGQSIELCGDDILYVAGSVTQFCSTDESYQNYVGVMFNGLEFAATDRHRIIRYKADGERVDTVLIRPRVFQVLRNLISNDDTVTICGSQFSTENFCLNFRAIDGKFPDIDVFIPKQLPNIISVDRLEFIQSIRFAENAANKNTHAMIMEVGNSIAKIQAEDIDFGKDAVVEVDVELPDITRSAPIRIGLNGAHIVAALNSFESKKVQIEYKDERTMILLHSHESQAMCAVMPVMFK